jgi:very-short-patch-repair endonuclease
MNYSQNLFYGASPEIHRRARELRKNLTPAELKLWDLLRSKSIGNLKFRRKHPIYQYIADFYCHELRLVIELDGGVHDEFDQQEHDSNRDLVIGEFDIQILRLKNEEVMNDPIKVMEKVRTFLP